jgi:hypothetical protein
MPGVWTNKIHGTTHKIAQIWPFRNDYNPQTGFYTGGNDHSLQHTQRETS